MLAYVLITAFLCLCASLTLKKHARDVTNTFEFQKLSLKYNRRILSIIQQAYTKQTQII